MILFSFYTYVLSTIAKYYVTMLSMQQIQPGLLRGTSPLGSNLAGQNVPEIARRAVYSAIALLIVHLISVGIYRCTYFGFI